MPKAYVQKFKKSWLVDPICRDWIAEEPGDCAKVLCKYCKTVFRAKYADIKQHVRAKKHYEQARFIMGNSKIDKYTFQSHDMVSLAEARQCLFIAEHTSLYSCDHLTGVCKTSFPDSTVANNLKLRQTKCSAIVTFALVTSASSPFAICSAMEDIFVRLPHNQVLRD